MTDQDPKKQENNCGEGEVEVLVSSSSDLQSQNQSPPIHAIPSLAESTNFTNLSQTETFRTVMPMSKADPMELHSARVASKEYKVSMKRTESYLGNRNGDLDRQIALLKNCECIRESEVRDLCNMARDILLEESNI